MNPEPQESPATRSRTAGYALAFFSAAAVGTLGAIGKLVLEALSPIAFSFWVYLLALPFCFVWMRLGGRGRSAAWSGRIAWLFATHVALGFVGTWAIFAGLARVDPAVVAFLGRTETLVSLLLGVVLLGERFRAREVGAAVIVLVGVCAMRLPDGVPLAAEQRSGFWLVLLGSVCIGASEVPAKVAMEYVAATTFALFRSMALVVLFLAAGLLCGELRQLPSAGTLALVAVCALLGPVAGRTLYLLALRRIELSKASVVAQLQPLFTVATAFVLLGTLPRLVEGAGGLLILAGTVLLVSRRE